MNRRGFNASYFNCEDRSHGQFKANVPQGGERNLLLYLTKLGLPTGLRGVIQSVYKTMESRIWIIDNSLDMKCKDRALMIADDGFQSITREDGASRWSEQLQVIDFHMKMAARAWIPTKFWTTNKPHDECQCYGICWGDPECWAQARDHASHKILEVLKPEQKANPIASEVLKIIKMIEPEATRLKKEGKFVSVIICTQGVPTNKEGDSGSAAMKECLENLTALSNLPVKIVFRMYTNEKKVTDFYKKVDLKMECDVLDSYWDEACEVYMHNPWLTYGIGLHRVREAGLGTSLMDIIDEGPLNINELYEWCMGCFVGESLLSMRHPSKDWNGFISDLQGFLKQEKMVYNPMKKKLCPWIDIAKLHSIYGRPVGVQRTRPRSQRKHYSTANASPSLSIKPLESRKNSSCNVNPPSHRKSTSQTKDRTGSFPTAPRIGAQRRLSSYHDPTKSSEVIKDQVQRALYECLDNKDPTERDLSSVIKEWSNKPDGKLRPLHMLLFEAPVLLPPNNPLVQHHKYFDNWKTLHRDAFKDEEGTDADELVIKVARRCKVFLHPDKWPSDLNDDQKFLLQSIWDTLSGSELF